MFKSSASTGTVATNALKSLREALEGDCVELVSCLADKVDRHSYSSGDWQTAVNLLDQAAHHLYSRFEFEAAERLFAKVNAYNGH